MILFTLVAVPVSVFSDDIQNEEDRADLISQEIVDYANALIYMFKIFAPVNYIESSGNTSNYTDETWHWLLVAHNGLKVGLSDINTDESTVNEKILQLITAYLKLEPKDPLSGLPQPVLPLSDEDLFNFSYPESVSGVNKINLWYSLILSNYMTYIADIRKNENLFDSNMIYPFKEEIKRIMNDTYNNPAGSYMVETDARNLILWVYYIKPIKSGNPTDSGIININDIIMLRDYIFNRQTLTKREFDAADVNRDYKVNIKDIVKIRDHIFGKRKLAGWY